MGTGLGMRPEDQRALDTQPGLGMPLGPQGNERPHARGHKIRESRVWAL